MFVVNNGPLCLKLKVKIRIIYRGSNTSGHFIWKKVLRAYFIWNDQECKILFIIWPFTMGFYCLQNEHYFKKITQYWHGHCQWRYAVYAPKCYYTCSYTICIAWLYLLNNSKTAAKNIRRLYGKITGNQLPVHFPLFFKGARKHFQESGTER